MKRIRTSKKQNKYIIILLIISTILFIVLYNKMIFKGYIYAYYDIGRDTIATYIPRFIFDGKWIKLGNGTQYSLQNGLGSYIYNPLYKYIFPYNFMMIFSEIDNLNVILLISLFIKIIIIAIFSFLYFNKITNNNRVAFIVSLMWTFSGYMIVWGQHYQFATLILEITVGMYFLQQYLEGKKIGILLVVPLVLMVWDSYFHLYMNGIFFAIYTVWNFWINDKNIKKCIKKLFGLVVMAITACGIAMVQLLPSIYSFFSSTRMDDVSVSEKHIDLIYNESYLITFVGRLLSPNIFGTGNNYTGAYNYYEAALFSVSIVMLFSVIFLLFTPKCKKMVSVLTATIICIVCPIFSQVLGMSTEKQRWSYLIAFLGCIGVALFFKTLQDFDDKRILHDMIKKTVLVTTIVYSLIVCALLIEHNQGEIEINKKSILCSICIFAVYAVLLMLYTRCRTKVYNLIFTIVVLFELILTNYPSINDRCVLEQKRWNNEYFNDGTVDIINALKLRDDGLYRVSKTYVSVGENDALVQGYNGLSVYSSLNTSEVVEFYKAAGYELIEGYPHWINIPVYDYYINCLMGTKYVIADSEITAPEYELIMEIDGKKLYENLNALSFGYLYSEQVYTEDIGTLDKVNRQKLLTKYFYLTDSLNLKENIEIEHINPYDIIEAEHTEIVDNIKKLKEACMTNVEFENNVLSGIIENKTKKNKMLVVPIIYNKNWHAYIDGNEYDVYNVNGGLLGVCIGEGKHDVKIEYIEPCGNVGAFISLISICIFIFYIIYIFRKDNNKGEFKNENSCICADKIE